MKKPTPQQIAYAFRNADEEFSFQKSTEFLIAYTADQLGIPYGDVVSALASVHAKDGQ